MIKTTSRPRFGWVMPAPYRRISENKLFMKQVAGPAFTEKIYWWGEREEQQPYLVEVRYEAKHRDYPNTSLPKHSLREFFVITGSDARVFRDAIEKEATRDRKFYNAPFWLLTRWVERQVSRNRIASWRILDWQK